MIASYTKRLLLYTMQGLQPFIGGAWKRDNSFENDEFPSSIHGFSQAHYHNYQKR
jgi:hypothetical protein